MDTTPGTASDLTPEQRLIIRLWCGEVPDGPAADHREYLLNLPADERTVLLAALNDPNYLPWIGLSDDSFGACSWCGRDIVYDADGHWACETCGSASRVR